MERILQTVQNTLDSVQKYSVLKVVEENARLHKKSIQGALDQNRDDLTYKLEETKKLLEMLKKATLRSQLESLIQKDLKLIDRKLELK